MVQIKLEHNENTLLFLADEKISQGLWGLNNPKQVEENMKTFDIEFESGMVKKKVKSDISKRNNFAILTIEFDSKTKTQFLIGEKLKLDDIKKLSDKSYPKDIKTLLKEAYKMTQKPITLGDFFKT